MILTALLTSTPDPQRDARWPCDPALVETLARSVEAHGERLVVLHDEEPVDPPARASWVRVDRRHPNPYFARWDLYARWLSARPPDEPVWCVDATDVELLRPPRPEPGSLYCGSEPRTLASAWMCRHHPSIAPLARAHPNRQVHNPCILGGPAEAVAQVARTIWNLANPIDLTDMAAFQLVAAKLPFATGEPVHTRFKRYEHDHPTAWWRHK